MKFFSEQALHSFQSKLLKCGYNPAEKDCLLFKKKLERGRSKYRDQLRPELIPFVVGSNRREIRNQSAMVQNRR